MMPEVELCVKYYACDPKTCSMSDNNAAIAKVPLSHLRIGDWFVEELLQSEDRNGLISSEGSLPADD